MAANEPLLSIIKKLRLVDERALRQVPANADPKLLVEKGLLTSYQSKMLLQGQGSSLALGSYIILDLLGEGGMGQVFKAKHQKMNRVVALKLIHKDRTQNETALRRFQREIHAAARLNHPNVVRAFDADEVSGQMILTMEFVDGSDLAKLVKEKGPLPVATACDYIRQSALGLQHASEQGLVHRDIKPQNLLLSKTGVVKILDMGLARRTEQSEDTTTLTQEGTVMGTADYLAPEQAISSHTVDIRADIYSLGATFYFLLAGQVPFPGGTLTEKLIKCQLQEPEPIEKLRPDVPPQIIAVLRKMMAKKPEDRYQTPAEVAAALTNIPQVKGKGVPLPVTMDGNTDTPQAIHTQADQPKRTRRRTKLLAAVAFSVLAILLLGIALLMRSGTKEPPPSSTPVSASEQITYLSDLHEAAVGNSANGAKVDKNMIRFKGKETHNLLTRPGVGPVNNVSVTYKLNGAYDFFVSEVGTVDAFPPNPALPLIFSVYGDSKLLWRSNAVVDRNSTNSFKLSVKGVRVLELKVECVGVDVWPVWGQPRLIK